MTDPVRATEATKVSYQAPQTSQAPSGSGAAEARAAGKPADTTTTPPTDSTTSTSQAGTDASRQSGYSAGDQVMKDVTDWMKGQHKGDVPIEKMKEFLESKGYTVERNGKTLEIRDKSGNCIKTLADNDGDGNIGMKDTSFRDAVSQLEAHHPELAGLFKSMAAISQWGKQGGGNGGLDGYGGIGGIGGIGAGFDKAMEADVTKRLAPVQAQFDEKGVQADAMDLWKNDRLTALASEHGVTLPTDLPSPQGANPYDTFRQVSALAMAPFLV